MAPLAEALSSATHVRVRVGVGVGVGVSIRVRVRIRVRVSAAPLATAARLEGAEELGGGRLEGLLAGEG